MDLSDTLFYLSRMRVGLAYEGIFSLRKHIIEDGKRFRLHYLINWFMNQLHCVCMDDSKPSLHIINSNVGPRRQCPLFRGNPGSLCQISQVCANVLQIPWGLLCWIDL